MKGILPATSLALAWAVTLGAQSTPPQPSQSTQGQPKSERAQPGAAKPVTLTGCLREGTEPNTYLLANVDMTRVTGGEGSTSSPAGGTTGSPATGGSTSGSASSSPLATGGSTATGRVGSSDGPVDSAKSVKLVGNADLQAHVGHEVQVTGTMVPPVNRSTQGQATGTTGSATGSATGETTSDTTSRVGEREPGTGAKNMPTLQVQSVKMVGSVCTKG